MELPAFSTRGTRADCGDRSRRGCRQFDAKVAGARATARRDRCASACASTTDWDRKRFPQSDRLVVARDDDGAAAGRLARRDDRRPHAVGRRAASSRRARSTRTSCSIRCSSSHGVDCRSSLRSVLVTTRSSSPTAVNVADFAARAGRARHHAIRRESSRCCRASPVKSHRRSTRASGFSAWRTPASIASRRRGRGRSGSIRRCRPPTARRSATRGSASSRTGTSARSRASATATACGKPSGGPQLPFYARNFRDVTQWLTRALRRPISMPRIVALEEAHFRDTAARRRHAAPART